MTDNLTEQHRRKRTDLSDAIDQVPGLRDRLSDDLRRRAERKGDGMRASLSAHLEESARRIIADATEYGDRAETARRIRRRRQQSDEEALARKLNGRATDAVQTLLERTQSAAAESCRLA